MKFSQLSCLFSVVSFVALAPYSSLGTGFVVSFESTLGPGSFSFESDSLTSIGGIPTLSDPNGTITFHDVLDGAPIYSATPIYFLMSDSPFGPNGADSIVIYNSLSAFFVNITKVDLLAGTSASDLLTVFGNPSSLPEQWSVQYSLSSPSFPIGRFGQTTSYSVEVVPEPSSFVLFFLGSIGASLFSSRAGIGHIK
jgi:hypothetical protein